MEDLYKDLLEIILPELRQNKLLRKGKKLRILSAGCSDGREPYSLAMMICKKFQSGSAFEFEITACDVNPALVKIADEGSYQLRNDEKMKLDEYSEYFKILTDNVIRVNKGVMEKITFRVEDILNLQGIGAYDIAVCANLLFYYEEDYRKKIVEKLAALIPAGGFLYTESIGTRFMKNLGLQRINPGAHYFKKISNRPGN